MNYLAFFLAIALPLFSANQTATLSPVLPETSLPFTLLIEQAPINLPFGLQGFAAAAYRGKWIFISGRTNGLHGFADVGNNFPPLFQNTNVIVVDPATGHSWSRSLLDPSAGLTQDEVDTLSVTSAEFFQKGKMLYLVGGYGINTSSGQMETKSTLTAINLKKLLKWVLGKKHSVKKAIRQVSDPFLQVTGGYLYQANDHEPFLLILGQNFAGLYRDSSNGEYTKQIRPFWLIDEGRKLTILPKISSKTFPDYRRRDLVVTPIIRDNQPAYTAFSGVFTLSTGVWTVPITIFPDGSSFEPDPLSPKTFKQAMNHYDCPAFGLYSTKTKDMYVVLPGGISYGYFSGGTFQTDDEIPFINQVTTIKIDKNDCYQQYLMNSEYPLIPSTGTNPGNALLFGAGAHFFVNENLSLFRNGVIQYDALPSSPVQLGYIVGGIMSTLPNTFGIEDSTSSPYIFSVKLIPK